MRVRWGGAAAAAADGAGRWHGAQVLRGRDACVLLQFTALLQSWTPELVCGSDIADSLTQQCGESETLLEFDARQSDYKI